MPGPITVILAAAGRRAARALPFVLAVTATLLVARAVMPARASAQVLFPIDDWISSGLSTVGGVVLGGLRIGARDVARLIAAVVTALADLLIPKSFVRAGLDGVRWLVQLPPVGTAVDASGVAGPVRMPHVQQLRSTLTWIGVTLLPLGLVLTAGRAFLAPGLEAESPSEVLGRALVAGLGLVVYDWVWGALTRLVALLTDALLSLPWVTDGVRRMLQALVVGGGAGAAVAAGFGVPLVVTGAGLGVVGLLRGGVGVEVAAALVCGLGGVVLGLSVTGFGRRLLAGWVIAAGAIVVLPLLWTVVFVTGAALMLDTSSNGGHGFAGFVAQLFNVAAALAVFWIAIKLGLGVFRHATSAIAGVTATPAAGARGAGRSGSTGRSDAGG